MATIKPFRCIRPCREKASRIAALPYDVYNEAEAREETAREPESFLRIDRPETQFPPGTDMYADEVYRKAHDLLWEMVDCGDFVREETPCYYIYELTMNGRTQTGITACASIDDYQNGVIRKHENTREEKELDRIRHVDACNAQTGPIFLAYRSSEPINAVVSRTKEKEPVYDFTAPDGVRHTVWIISDPADIGQIRQAFAAIDSIYIADGHHRSASAVKVGLKRRREHPDYDGSEPFNYFLSVLFPDDQLYIMDYNRVLKDLNGLTSEEFLQKLREVFEVSLLTGSEHHPQQKGEFTAYLDGNWYLCRIKPENRSEDPVNGLDVSLLQNLFLEPVLGIKDPKTDPRIDFVGGIRGTEELERRCGTDCRAAFAMYPTSIHELFAVADAGRLMPPKSTWFEPKLRSGLFIHEI
ncbi:MAG: DUF1015 domain-containing protein [Lachnospiraceae bacterium]|jgi:uncharacterized protein (DUF1015 family)|nr:DUF1015 domain-containing protein [Lachnospiraceae bacterium]MCI1656932.1 DUF1015 domain-containing protein [Lachnospiraceae bacterium]MCI2195412.1 DUF1015 domain-containing protein [Lachnospiraceae bacterium]